jgi:hypothetical protein
VRQPDLKGIYAIATLVWRDIGKDTVSLEAFGFGIESHVNKVVGCLDISREAKEDVAECPLRGFFTPYLALAEVGDARGACVEGAAAVERGKGAERRAL